MCNPTEKAVGKQAAYVCASVLEANMKGRKRWVAVMEKNVLFHRADISDVIGRQENVDV